MRPGGPASTPAGHSRLNAAAAQVGDQTAEDTGGHRQQQAARGLAARVPGARELLLAPGMLEEPEAVLRFVAEELGPDTYVDLMAQYYPAGLVGDGRDSYLEINRHLYREEFLRAVEIGRDLGLRAGRPQRPSAAQLQPAGART